METKAILYPDSEKDFNNFVVENKVALDKAKRIRIEGHSDKIGDFEKNRKLSIERAILIRDLLLMENLDPNKIEIKGYSHLKILSFKRDESSKLRNRRVEIKII